MLITKIEAEMVMTKVAADVQNADHRPQAAVALPLLLIVAGPLTVIPVVAVGLVHLPGTANQVLPGTTTRANNAIPADSLPAGVAVRAMAAGLIQVAAIATAVAAATATAAAAIVATANYY